MNQCLKNLRDLFSENDAIVYQALLEKKDWINQSFYIVGSFSFNEDIEDLLDYKIRFRQLYLDQTISKKKQKDFQQFKVLFLYNEMPKIVEEDEFVIKYNFSLLKKEEYLKLFANFYPCLNQEEMDAKESNYMVELLKLAMNKNLGDNVLILEDKALVNSCFSCKIVEEIYYNKLNEGYLKYLKMVCEELHYPLKEQVL